MVYTALLRGINVGGKNKLSMQALRSCFERAGMSDVETYIASGNVVFRNTTSSVPIIRKTLEQAILDEFALDIKVLVIDLGSFQHILDAIPPDWSNDKEQKSDVMFLWKKDDNEGILEKILTAQGIDTVIYTPGAVLWHVPRSMQSRSRMNRLVGTALYKNMTIRNVNTVRKIALMLDKLNQL